MTTRHGRPRRTRTVVLLAGVLMLAGGCGASDGPTTTYPPSTIGPGRTVTPAVAQTRAALVTALGGERLGQLRELLLELRVFLWPPES